MTTAVTSELPVTLVGASPEAGDRLAQALAIAPVLVAADGGAAEVIASGHWPRAVIGDMDSLPHALRNELDPHIVHHVTEQDSTDFEKCLSRIEAPLILAVGFSGGRMDHALAVMNVLARYPGHRCIVLGSEDLVMLAPPEIELNLAVGSRLSLFPMASVTGEGIGLRWPIDGIEFGPGGVIGTSNEVTGPVRLSFGAPGMLLILPVGSLDLLVDALQRAPGWEV